MMEGEEEHLWCLESAVMATGTQLTAALRLIIKQQIDTPSLTHNLLLLTWLVTSDLLSCRDCLTDLTGPPLLPHVLS